MNPRRFWSRFRPRGVTVIHVVKGSLIGAFRDGDEARAPWRVFTAIATPCRHPISPRRRLTVLPSPDPGDRQRDRVAGDCVVDVKIASLLRQQYYQKAATTAGTLSSGVGMMRSRGRVSSAMVFVGSCIAGIALVFLYSYLNSTSSAFSSSSLKSSLELMTHDDVKYLYWGPRIDCPGKHCLSSCEGLGHQESSLRCALEEAIFLRRTFVMPSRMCINPGHNKKGTSDQSWNSNSCSMDSLYDISLISQTVPVILDNSKTWYKVLTTSMKLGDRGVSHVHRVARLHLKNTTFSNLLLINRTASPLSWFAECRNRNNGSALILPYSFLPSMAAKKLRNAADKIKEILGDYDAMHVRRGDRLMTRRDGAGVERTLSPHLDRDTRPEFILRRIEKWVLPGRTLYIASNERTPGFFSPLSVRYKLAYSSNYSHIWEQLIDNNYQLFMIERLILRGAKTFIKTFKEDDSDLYLTDDPKKTNKNWQIPVYTMEE